MSQSNRRSLVDDSMESVGTSKKAKSKSGGGSGNGVKIAIIAVCLGLAAILLAYQFGVIPNPFEEKVKPPSFTPEEQAQIQNYEQEAAKAVKTTTPPVRGGE